MAERMPSLFGTLFVAVVGWTNVLLEPPASGSVTLDWDAPPECPQQSQLRARVEQLLGEPLDATSGEHFAAHGVVRHDGARWDLELALSTADGTERRPLEADSCEALTEAAAVVISIALAPRSQDHDPPTREETPVAPEGPRETRAPDDTPPPAKRPRPRAAQPRSRAEQPRSRAEQPRSRPKRASPAPIGGFVRAVGGFSVGPLPSITPVVGLGLGLRRRAFRTELLGRYAFARTATRDESSARIAAWTVAAQFCFAPAWRRLEFPLCAGTELGMIMGRGDNVEAPRSHALLWAAADLNAGLIVRPIPRLGIGVQADLVVPFTHPGFSVDGVGLLHRASAIGAYGLLGIEVCFP